MLIKLPLIVFFFFLLDRKLDLEHLNPAQQTHRTASSTFSFICWIIKPADTMHHPAFSAFLFVHDQMPVTVHASVRARYYPPATIFWPVRTIGKKNMWCKSCVIKKKSKNYHWIDVGDLYYQI